MPTWWDDDPARPPIPKFRTMMYALVKNADDTFRVLLAFNVGDPYQFFNNSPHMGSSQGRPESEISRFGPGDASGDYSNLQFKSPADATWSTWRSLDCDYSHTTMNDWRVHRDSSSSWHSEHLPAAGSGCE